LKWIEVESVGQQGHSDGDWARRRRSPSFGAGEHPSTRISRSSAAMGPARATWAARP
jgi:hypothetical protein